MPAHDDASDAEGPDHEPVRRALVLRWQSCAMVRLCFALHVAVALHWLVEMTLDPHRPLRPLYMVLAVQPVIVLWQWRRRGHPMAGDHDALMMALTLALLAVGNCSALLLRTLGVDVAACNVARLVSLAAAPLAYALCPRELRLR